MADKKFSQFTDGSINQSPADELVGLDVSLSAANQNTRWTLNDLFSKITRNIADKALRFQAGSLPLVSDNDESAIYSDGTQLLVSNNGSAYVPIGGSISGAVNGNLLKATTATAATDSGIVSTQAANSVNSRYNVADYASLAAAIAAIGSAQATLVVPSSTTIAASLTVPANVDLEFTNTGKLNVAPGQTVTINGGISAGLHQIFTGSGAVSFTTNNRRVIGYSPHWWGATGDGTTDDTAAWTAMLAAIPNGATVNEIPPTANYKITSTLTLSNRQQVAIVAGNQLPITGLPRMTYAGAVNGRLWDILDCYQVTLQGFSLQATVDIDRYVKTDRVSGFNSQHVFRYLYFNAGHQYNSNFIALSIDESGGLNNENMTVEDCVFIVSGDTSYLYSNQGSINSGSANLTIADGVLTSADNGKTIRIGGAGTAGATLLTSILNVTSPTTCTLNTTASTTVASGARVHIGNSYGVGIYNGPNQNAKHQVFRNLSIKNADKGIYSRTGSFTLCNLGNGFNNYGIYIEDATEPVIIEQQVQEGNLVELYSIGQNAPLEIRNCRGSNTWQLTEGFYYLSGNVSWSDSQVETLPPSGGKIIVSPSGYLILTLSNTLLNVAGSGISLDESGLSSIYAAQNTVYIDGDCNINGLPSGTTSIGIQSLNQQAITTRYGYALPFGNTVYNASELAAAFALWNRTGVDTICVGDDELEIAGLFRCTAPSGRVIGSAGATTYSLVLVAVDANGLRSLRSTVGQVSNANATLSASNYIQVTWAQVPNAATYELHRSNPLNSGQGVLIASGIIGTSYNITANPGTGYAAWDTLTPAYNQASAVKIRTSFEFPLEGTFADGDTSPDVTSLSDYVTANTAPTSITTFDVLGAARSGMIRRIRANDANTTFVNGATLVTGTGANISAVNGKVYQFIYRASAWRLI